jgi:hypothetical protein
MNARHAVWATARADFLERSRRPGYLVILGVTLYAAFVFLPPNHARYATLQFGGHRGIYNSAWVGSQVSLLTSIFLSMVGFYLVKNAVAGDRRSRVGAILAGTPMTKLEYVLGKMLSNLAILSSIVALLVVGAGAMQWIRGEDPNIAPLPLIAPFVLGTLPAMAMVAAVAVLFEVVPGLRGGMGNVAWFFLWTLGLAQTSFRGSSIDLLGVSSFTPSMMAACKQAFPEYDVGAMRMSLGLTFKSSGLWDLTTFRWDGPEWTARMVALRALWIAFAFATCLAAAWIFDRFDAPEVAVKRTRRAAREPGRSSTVSGPTVERVMRLTPLPGTFDFGLVPMMTAELKLLLRGTPLVLGCVVAGLIVASLLAPPVAVTRGILPALWILPLFLWSSLGNREAVHGVEALIRSAPRPELRPVLAQWLAGVLIALGVSLGALVRWTVAADFGAVLSLLAGAAFVPALAVALGAWSRGPKLFEVIYLFLWYAGPLNRAPGLDFIGSGSSPVAASIWALLAAAAIVAAIAARRRV